MPKYRYYLVGNVQYVPAGWYDTWYGFLRQQMGISLAYVGYIPRFKFEFKQQPIFFDLCSSPHHSVFVLLYSIRYYFFVPEAS